MKMAPIAAVSKMTPMTIGSQICLRCLILWTAKIVKRDHFTKSIFMLLGTLFFCTFAAEIKTNRMENPSLEQKVKSIIDQIRPYLQQDGGDIEFVPR